MTDDQGFSLERVEDALDLDSLIHHGLDSRDPDARLLKWNGSFELKLKVASQGWMAAMPNQDAHDFIQKPRGGASMHVAWGAFGMLEKVYK